MTWHYQLMDHGDYVAVHEYYNMEDGDTFTVEPTTLEAEDKEDMLEQLAMILLDVHKHGVVPYE